MTHCSWVLVRCWNPLEPTPWFLILTLTLVPSSYQSCVLVSLSITHWFPSSPVILLLQWKMYRMYRLCASGARRKAWSATLSVWARSSRASAARSASPPADGPTSNATRLVVNRKMYPQHHGGGVTGIEPAWSLAGETQTLGSIWWWMIYSLFMLKFKHIRAHIGGVILGEFLPAVSLYIHKTPKHQVVAGR